MGARFARLRIAGFKSFAEAASVEILPGLTGIVGPNGCGKSNVIEALRWVMGESSARSLRGGEMDDLIFAGTAARAARNLAEVTLTLEEAAGAAPPPFHDQAELQISRRIERGAGSFYRINGREARARDVQTLFADLASGARSSAMVSQGRVSAIVNARPEERRSILEEAAGITGLHARRHEAELKLRATEANLSRAADLRQQIEARLGELGAQSREAVRYREIAAGLREAEAGLLALLHARARAAVQQARRECEAAGSVKSRAERRATASAHAEEQAQAALAAPREAQAEARTALERQRIAAESLTLEEERATSVAAAAGDRLRQSRQDAEQAGVRLRDAGRARARAAEQHEACCLARASYPQRLDQAELELREAQRQLEHATACLAQATADETALRNQTDRLAEDRETTQTRVTRLHAQCEATREELHDARANLVPEAEIERLRLLSEQTSEQLTSARASVEQASERHAAGSRNADRVQSAHDEAGRVRQALQRELDAAIEQSRRLDAEQDQIRSRLAASEQDRVSEARCLESEAALRDERNAAQEARRALEDAEGARAQAQLAAAQAVQLHLEGERHQRQLGQILQRALAARDQANMQLEQTIGEIEQVRAETLDASELASADDLHQAARGELARCNNLLAEAENARLDAEQAHAATSRSLADARAEQGLLAAEAEGLSRSLALTAPRTDQPWVNLAESVEVPSELTTAFAAVLAESLQASLDGAAPACFRLLPELACALPAGCTPLSTLIEAPAPLARLLSHAGLLDREQSGEALHATLEPGQCVVSRTGELWRWDGLHQASTHAVTDSASARGAIMLEQRSRLKNARLQAQQLAVETAAIESENSSQASESRAHAERAITARKARDAAERAHSATRDQSTALRARQAANDARLESLRDRRETAASQATETDEACSSLRSELGSLPEALSLQEQAARAQQAERDAMREQAIAKQMRAEAETRAEAAGRMHAALTSRHAETEGRIEILASQHEQSRSNCLAASDARDQAAVRLASLPDLALIQLQSENALQAARLAGVEEDAARERNRQAQAECDQAAKALAEAVARNDREASRIKAITPYLAGLEQEHQETGLLLDELQKRLAQLGAQEEAIARTRASTQAVERIRADHTACSELRARLAADAASLEANLPGLAATLDDWQSSEAAAHRDHEDTLRRMQTDAETLQELERAPREAERRRADHQLALTAAEHAFATAHAELSDREQAALAAREERHAADLNLTQAREAELTWLGRAEQADAILAQAPALTSEPPQPAPADLSEGAETGLRRRIARLGREREELGPVNLRAEIECHEAQAKADAIAREQEELEAAIARLRGSIGHLNREGRERLLAVFEQVNRHFQSLFARMFNGGRAHLGMVGDDDPLQAGLEIYAQPPGKKLSTLSLLSGGEQALTALSLIFAVFACNPAPVCVLDEVDAPLDDANVARFVALLADMVAQAGTRFLVVTHHQLTMAHMDRLYGVTMQERGVSRLLSVDLAAAAGMILPARETV